MPKFEVGDVVHIDIGGFLVGDGVIKSKNTWGGLYDVYIASIEQTGKRPTVGSPYNTMIETLTAGGIGMLADVWMKHVKV